MNVLPDDLDYFEKIVAESNSSMNMLRNTVILFTSLLSLPTISTIFSSSNSLTTTIEILIVIIGPYFCVFTYLIYKNNSILHYTYKSFLLFWPIIDTPTNKKVTTYKYLVHRINENYRTSIIIISGFVIFVIFLSITAYTTLKNDLLYYGSLILTPYMQTHVFIWLQLVSNNSGSIAIFLFVIFFCSIPLLIGILIRSKTQDLTYEINDYLLDLDASNICSFMKTSLTHLDLDLEIPDDQNKLIKIFMENI